MGLRWSGGNKMADENDAMLEGARCLDCGAQLAGKYCSTCGQNSHLHRNLGAIGHDLAHGVLHFEGKFWRTIPLLTLRPGELTRRYIDGERTRVLSPIATFLLTVFLMFGVISAVGRQAYYVEDDAARLAPGQSAEQTSAPVDFDLRDAPAPLRVVDQAWKDAKANPSLLAYKLQSNAYKFSWALIPIFVPLLWALFLHRRRYRENYKAYEHTIFVTYSLAFISLFIVGATLLKLTGLNGPVMLLPLAIPLLHTFVHLRGAYQLSSVSALWRTAALSAFTFLAALLFFLFMLMFGLLASK
jgi:hypothetical protein